MYYYSLNVITYYMIILKYSLTSFFFIWEHMFRQIYERFCAYKKQENKPHDLQIYIFLSICLVPVKRIMNYILLFLMIF